MADARRLGGLKIMPDVWDDEFLERRASIGVDFWHDESGMSAEYAPASVC